MINKQVLWNLLVCAAFLFSSCSSVMRPPPASPFMDSYNRNNVVQNQAFTYYAGDLDNSKHETSGSGHYSHAEWWGDFNFARYINSDYFTIGWGQQTITSFLQTGFVTPYLGVTGWSNLFFFTEDTRKKFSGGVMVIEQVPLNDKWTIGFTEHFSRNGREFYYTNDESCEGVSMFCNTSERHPKFYTEIGGGFYISRKLKQDKLKIALEARYGRDITEEKNRYTLTLNFWTTTPMIPFAGNDGMRKAAKNNLKKTNNLKTAFINKRTRKIEDNDSLFSTRTDSLHSISRQWFKLFNKSQTLSETYTPRDSVTAVTTTGICYDSKANAVWLMQDYGNIVYQVSADSLDYCQKSERDSQIAPAITEGIVASLIGGPLTGSFFGGIAIGVGVGTAFGIPLTFILDEPKKNANVCSEKHTKEQIIEWLKQYPCGGYLQTKTIP